MPFQANALADNLPYLTKRMRMEMKMHMRLKLSWTLQYHDDDVP
jgi:hypothetical protein